MNGPSATKACSTCSSFLSTTVKPPIGNPPMAEHTADTEQFPWSQYATLTYRRFQLRNNFFIRNKNSGPEPVPYLEFLLYLQIWANIYLCHSYQPGSCCRKLIIISLQHCDCAVHQVSWSSTLSSSRVILAPMTRITASSTRQKTTTGATSVSRATRAHTPSSKSVRFLVMLQLGLLLYDPDFFTT